ncbi:hypothetical protein F4553_000513 [Allocatelliglobosispora scoriae]|uniref:CASPASE and TPR Repeat-Associated N-terminal domain-containing protein n=1 Tax=Allocatelliglobosispora scoriae TaxID=643052 RepID=A0A841BFR8_9ACTN|nr:CATRA conflict system CASPASE/TPR repeat-associated protein [Allocatelliglobosispora scoriae]MBB5867134.1 hypothetical protein [Allocatelliglobosispora scoriae]
MAGPLTSAALHVHCFSAAGQDAYRRAVGDAVTGLGMVEVQAPTAAAPPDGFVGLHAAPGGGILEALQYRDGDLTAHSVCLAPDPAVADASWSVLDRRWRDLGTDPAPQACMLEARVLYALYGGGPPDAVAIAGLLPAEVGPLRPAAADLGDGIRVWATGSPHDALRYLVVVAPRDHEAEADGWLWPDGRTDLPRVPRYLWEAAKVSYRMRQIRAAGPDGGWTGAHADILLGDLDEPDADRVVAEAHRRADALALTQAMLADSRTGVAAVLANLALLIFVDAPAAASRGPFHADLVTWEADLVFIADRTALVSAARDRVEALARMAARQREHTASAAVARNSHAIVAQAAIIGAFLLALSAAQTLHYDWPFRPSLRLPAITMVTAMALLLPLATASPRHTRSVWRVAAECGVCAASGWLVTTVAAYASWGRPAPVAVTLMVVLAAITVDFVWWHSRTSRRSS